MYKETTKTLGRSIAEGSPWSIDRSFVNLALIESEKEKQKQKQRQSKKKQENFDFHDHHVHQAEKVYEHKRAISYHELFQDAKETGKIRQKIFMMGAAGAGKTTLSQRVAYEWSHPVGSEAKLRLPSGIELVIWIKLRDLKAHLDLEDIDQRLHEKFLEKRLIYNEHGVLDTCKILACYLCAEEKGLGDKFDLSEIAQHFNAQQDHILYLLDGYDEIASLKETDAVKQIFNHLLKQPWVLVTSRPSQTLPEQSTFRQLELLGFRQADMLLYVDLHFETIEDKTGCALLKDLLQRNTAVRGLAHIPVNLEILCTIMQERGQDETPLNLEQLNATLLYEVMVFKVMKLSYEKKLFSKPFVSAVRGGFEDKATFFRAAKKFQLFPFLGALALKGLKTRQLQFSTPLFKKGISKHVEMYKNNITFFNDVLSLGFIRGFLPNKEKTDFTGTGEFLHLTLQEFFAAWLIADAWVAHREAETKNIIELTRQPSLSEEELKTLLDNYKYAASFAMVWPFVVGLLAQEKDKRYLGAFIRLIEAPPLELRGLFHDPLRVRCLEELLPDAVPDDSPWAIFVKLIETNFGQQSGDWGPPKPTLKALQASPAWGNRLSTVLCQRLVHDNQQEKKTALAHIRRWGAAVGTSTLLEQLTSILKAPSSKSSIKIATCETLGQLGLRVSAEAWPTIFEALTCVLCEGNNSEVKAAACEALGQLSAGVSAEARPILVEALTTALHEDDVWVRINTCRALCQLGPEVSAEVWLTIFNVLTCIPYEGLCGRGDMRKPAAYEVLSQLGSAVSAEVRPTLVKALTRALQGGDMEVKVAASWVLSQLDHAVSAEAWPTIVDALIRALCKRGEFLERQREFWGRKLACAALGQLVPRVSAEAWPTIFEALTRALREGDAEVVACGVLGHLGSEAPAEAWPTILEILIRALHRDDREIKAAACWALGQLNPGVSAEGGLPLVEALTTALREGDSEMKAAACWALGKLGPAVSVGARSALLEALRTALCEGDNWVNKKVCMALGRLAQSTAGQERDQLIMLLEFTLRAPHENVYVKFKAYHTLIKLGQSVSEETWVPLIAVLKNEIHGGNKARACQALCHLAQTSSTSEKTFNRILEVLLYATKKDQDRKKTMNGLKKFNPFNEVTSTKTLYLDPNNGILCSFTLDLLTDKLYFIRALDDQGNFSTLKKKQESEVYFNVTLETVSQILGSIAQVRGKEYLENILLNSLKDVFSVDPVSQGVYKQPNNPTLFEKQIIVEFLEEYKNYDDIFIMPNGGYGEHGNPSLFAGQSLVHDQNPLWNNNNNQPNLDFTPKKKKGCLMM